MYLYVGDLMACYFTVWTTHTLFSPCSCVRMCLYIILEMFTYVYHADINDKDATILLHLTCKMLGLFLNECYVMYKKVFCFYEIY